MVLQEVNSWYFKKLIHDPSRSHLLLTSTSFKTSFKLSERLYYAKFSGGKN
jgi:hypothetical protein